MDPTAARAALTGKSNLSDEEFQKQFGYGIATLCGRGTQQTDPNDRIRQNLGQADQLAYDQALSGGEPQQTFSVAADRRLQSTRGLHQTGHHSRRARPRGVRIPHPSGPVDAAALEEVRRLEVDFSNSDVAREEQHIVPVEDTVRAEKERAFREANAELRRKVKPPGG